MFAIVESGSITSMPKGNRGVEINGVKHSADVFTSKWTESERNAIGIYTVEIDETNKKDEQWYINTNITYAFGSGKVTGSYGTATAKAIADTKWTQKEIDDGDAPTGADTNTVKTIGLTNEHKDRISGEAHSRLISTDWYASRKAEAGTAIPSAVATYRAAVRTAAADMHTKIDAADTVAKLEALYVYNTDNPPTRPLGAWPTPVE